MILLADSEDPDQTARMYSLIWVFAVGICQKTSFRMARPIFSDMRSIRIIIFLNSSQKHMLCLQLEDHERDTSKEYL